jgi:hypothetical protein
MHCSGQVMARNPFHAKAHAAMKAGAKRTHPNIFKRVEPKVIIPGALDYPHRAMKSSDFTEIDWLYD